MGSVIGPLIKVEPLGAQSVFQDSLPRSLSPVPSMGCLSREVNILQDFVVIFGQYSAVPSFWDSADSLLLYHLMNTSKKTAYFKKSYSACAPIGRFTQVTYLISHSNKKQNSYLLTYQIRNSPPFWCVSRNLLNT